MAQVQKKYPKSVVVFTKLVYLDLFGIYQRPENSLMIVKINDKTLKILVFSVTRRYRSDDSYLLDVSIDLTDVTLVSDDTYRRLY